MKVNCRFFNGYKPCKHQKDKYRLCNEHCKDCEEINEVILIIKKGAAGEVLRCTPLLRQLRQKGTYIFWLTDYPELLNRQYVDEILKFDEKSILYLKSLSFDYIYQLDKDKECCALLSQLHAKIDKGFALSKLGRIVPADKSSEHLWTRGVDDEYMKKNKKHYIEEIFEVCDLKFAGEKYILPEKSYFLKKHNFNIDINREVVGLNTGASDLWKPRKYSPEKWIKLAQKLMELSYEVVLLGGELEHKANSIIADKTGAKYFGFFDIDSFIFLVNHINIMVTVPTLALHLGIALNKKIVLLNNVFNKHEFHLYGNGVILEPDLDCLACYRQDFNMECENNCLDLISVDKIIKNIELMK